MPELPEVETVRRGLAPHAVGQRIGRVVVREARLRWPVPRRLPQQIKGCRIESVERRAKYLLLPLDSGDRLLIHLGMSGRLSVHEGDTALLKHDHVDIALENGTLLRYHDPRRFGAVLLWPAREREHVLLRGLGPEPFAPEFGGDYLFERSRGRSAAVKNFIMDGRIVVGAGNIYATEALFRAGLRPSRPAGRLSRAHCGVLADTIREVLAEAVEQGGTTLRDFRNNDGAPGYFQQDLYVYGRQGEPCRVCATPIRRVVIGQRSSFYCPRCQR